MWKAFEELEALGLIGPEKPRIVSVQSEATAPIVHAFEAGASDTTTVEPGSTIAVGLNVPGGVGHFKVLEILYESEGCAVSVSEEAIAEALRSTFSAKGWWIGSEGAACIAALEQLVDRAVIRPGDNVVAFNTGSAEKYLSELRHLLTNK